MRVVVIGSGIAGLTAALHAHRGGCSVTVVTKDALGEGNTRYAQGGVAAAMAWEDSAELHASDTLAAGAGLCDPDAVGALTQDAPQRIAELVASGVAFDRAADGTFDLGREAAHAVNRILHAGGDATGRAIADALARTVRDAGIAVREHSFVSALELDAAGAVIGVRTLDEQLRADAVVLATGGHGQMYAHTTNPAGATGDGIALALRAGAVVTDLEFVQFHPTVLAAGEPFLISEAVRGEGASVHDEAGRRFAFDAHPDGELAPRDVMARASAEAMAAQGGRPVWLDATSLGADFLVRRFPTIDAAVRARGFDWSRERIPVTPAEHYLMGGVATDLHGRATVPGLYAVGEVARTGVHGANRLASNSLLEGAVFGARAGDDLARGGGPAPLVKSPQRTAVAPAADAPPFSRRALAELMWNHAGIARNDTDLRRAAAVVERWRGDACGTQDRAGYEDGFLLDVASETLIAALARDDSVGAHVRTDAASLPIGAPA